MTGERDPVRWTEAGSDCDPALRRALDTAREGLGDAARADALALRIEQAMRAEAAGGVQDGLGSNRFQRLKRWLSGVGIAGMIAGLGAAAWSARPVAPAPDSPEAARAAAERSAPEAARAAAERAQAGSARRAAAPGEPLPRQAPPAPTAIAHDAHESMPPEVLSADRASATVPAKTPAERTSAGRTRAPQARRGAAGFGRAETRRVATAIGDGDAPAQTDVPPELQLLSAAQRALRASPADALALADLHARAYPSGRFAEEREEIAVTALFALGDRAAGRARARAFLTRYPRSLSAPRIAALLDDPR